GWIADLVSANLCRPGDLLNPASELRGHSVYQALLSAATNTQGADGCPTENLGAGFCGLGAEWNETEKKWTKLFYDTAPVTDRRADLIARRLAERGYNSNYVASWFLVRGGVRLSRGGSSYKFTNSPSGGARGQFGSMGPLTRRALDNARVGSNVVALLGNAASADPSKAALSLSIEKSPATYYAGGGSSDQSAVQYLDTRAPLTDSYCVGPAVYNPGTARIELLPADTDLTTQVRCERGEQSCGTADTSLGASHGWLQDSRGFAAVHSGSCNILMADGGVRMFADTNRDGYLNPGFPIRGTHSEEELNRVGYRSSIVELPEAQFFSGVFLEKVRAGF
ncbi:MAG: DUF1559 domain-containing protein, partial [Planctomycetota bacterium]